MSETFPHGRAGFKKLGCHCDDCEFRRHQPGYVDKGCRCRVCKDGQNEYVTGQRNRRKNGGRKSARTRGSSVTRSGALPGATESPAERPERPRPASTPGTAHGRAVGATDPGKGQGESPARMGNAVAPSVAPRRSPGVPPERPESPAKRSRPTGGSDAPGWEMPRMWSVGEPSYAAGHRDYFAGMVSAVMTDPEETRYVHITADGDTQEDKQSAKQEAKDFYRLIKAFKKRNPGLIQVQGSELKGLTYYAFTIYRDGYELTSDDEETADDGEPESEVTETPESAETAPEMSVNTSYSARSMSYTFHKAFREGTCTMTVKGMSPCGNIADGTYRVTGHDVCEKHYEEVKALYPSRVTYVRPGWDYSAPNIGTTPARGPRNV